jgi:tetratricopeptide (TPR) repeat protein
MISRALWIAAAAGIAISCARGPEASARRFAARGDEFASRGRDTAAVIEYRNAIREWPTWSEAYRKLGEAFERLGRTDEAHRAFTQAATTVDGEPLPTDEAGLRAVIGRRPDLVPARLTLARLLLDRGDGDGALGELQAATLAEPDNELANRGLASLYLERDRLEDAEACLTRAATHEPQRFESRLALADFLTAQRRYDEARSWLDRAAVDPRLGLAVSLRRAAIDFEEGRVRRAEDAVSALLETDPTADGWALQAEFQLRGGDAIHALASAREALALDPDLAAARALVDRIRTEQPGPAEPSR